MNQKMMPITLITTVSLQSCRSLCERLKFLGYQDVDAIGCAEFMEKGIIENRIFIVPLSCGLQSKISSNIIPILQRIQHNPVLGIIHTSTEKLNRCNLRFCNEFLYWPCDKGEIDLRIERLGNLLENNELMNSFSQFSDEYLCLNMVGSSPPFIHVLKQIKKISRCDASVLIEGESGTGKELTARAIHYLGNRRDYPFIPVNCGAIPDSLLENELFGHQQGAFTDAKTSQEGLVCQAEGGTLFLDEIETFSPKGQVVLLRFLQDSQYKSLGSSTYKKANVRMIAASNANLLELVEKGEFRKDLYYRLDIMSIEMPPLSHRGNDILELANYFLNKFKIKYNQPEKRIHTDSIQWLMQYGWPGNVRELENLLHKEFLLADGPYIILGEEHANQGDRRKSPIDRRQFNLLEGNFSEVKTRLIEQFEKTYLTQLLSETEGNITLAAKKAGKERRSLGKLIKKHGIDKNSPV